MGLTFNVFILAPLIGIVALSYAVYKKYWMFAGLIIALMAFSLVFNPIKLTQSNISVYEGAQNRFEDIPEKVQVIEETFNEHQNKNLNRLKKESQNEQP